MPWERFVVKGLTRLLRPDPGYTFSGSGFANGRRFTGNRGLDRFGRAG